ncbi:MAG: DMT family transporter [Rhodospirillales bacterium]|nr:DMT family transporter [Rhodospirillales bacterium]
MAAYIPNPSPVQSNLKGILWMLFYAVAISVMHTSIRFVSEGMHPFEIAFFRCVFALITVAPFFIRQGWAPLRTKRFPMLLTRGVINIYCMLAFFYAVSIVPLAEITALSFSAPIFAVVLAVFIFKEKVGLRRWSAIFVGFLGTVVILRPGFQEFSLGQFLVLSSAFAWAICIIIVKELGKTETSVTIATYMSLVMAPLSLIAAVGVWVWPTPEQWFWLAFIGIIGGAGQMAMTESLRSAPTHVVSPIDFTRLIFIATLGFIFFDQVPDGFVWAGGTLIIGATVFITYREHQLGKALKTPIEAVP